MEWCLFSRKICHLTEQEHLVSALAKTGGALMMPSLSFENDAVNDWSLWLVRVRLFCKT